MKCATCQDKNCDSGKDCIGNSAEYKARYLEKYGDIAKASAEVIREGNGKLNRLEEIVLFAKKMKFRKLGIAFCIAMKKEAEMLAKFLQNEKNFQFEVYSVCCKIGGINKKDIKTVNRLDGREEITCNPCAQAHVLNRQGTDLNILLGLCVGHDMMFQKESNAFCTTLLVKDRANNNCTFKIFEKLQ